MIAEIREELSTALPPPSGRRCSVYVSPTDPPPPWSELMQCPNPAIWELTVTGTCVHTGRDVVCDVHKRAIQGGRISSYCEACMRPFNQALYTWNPI